MKYKMEIICPEFNSPRRRRGKLPKRTLLMIREEWFVKKIKQIGKAFKKLEMNVTIYGDRIIVEYELGVQDEIRKRKTKYGYSF